MESVAHRSTDEVAAEISSLWNDVLLQQFHDIIPGSSIAWVAADTEASHARVTDRLEALVEEAGLRFGFVNVQTLHTTTAIVIVSQTAWFRNWLRGYIVREAGNYLNGTLSIGSLGGNLFFGFEM